MVIIVPGFIFAFFLPNQTLGDMQNLVEEHGMLGQNQTIEGETIATVEPATVPETKEVK